MQTFFIETLSALQYGDATLKIKSTLLVALFFSPISYISQDLAIWTITNSQYVTFVVGAIALDHILGTIIHLFIKYDFSPKKNIVGLCIKIGLVVAVGFLFEGINAIIQEESVIKDYLLVVLRLSVFLYPAGSAFVNSAIITGGKFPPKNLLGKITNFQKNLDLKEFKKTEKD